MASKKVATKKKAGKALATREAVAKKLAAMAEHQTRNVKLRAGSFISLSGKRFSFGDAILGSELDVIILAFNYERRYYDGTYDKENPSGPACYALGDDPDQQTPADNAPEPQCKTCEECEHNEWGSSATGNGKACGQHIRIALIDGKIMDNEKPLDVLRSGSFDIPMIRLGVTTGKPFEAYAEGLKKRLSLPPFGVVTSLTFDDEVDWPKLEFNAKETITDMAVLSQLIELVETDEVTDLLFQGYDPEMYIPPAPSGRGRGKKKAPKKKKVAAKKKAPAKKSRGKFRA